MDIKSFSEISENEREYILNECIDTKFLIDRETLNFDNIEKELDESSSDVYSDFELFPVDIEKKFFTQELLFSPFNNKGLWIRTMVRTYLNGGKVLYKKFNENNFIVSLRFRQ